jgi:hypothetical protein
MSTTDTAGASAASPTPDRVRAEILSGRVVEADVLDRAPTDATIAHNERYILVSPDHADVEWRVPESDVTPL